MAITKNGINVVSGKLIYDSNIFESVSFKGINNWSCAYNNEEKNENEGKFVLITTAGNVTEEKYIAQIELELKPNVTEQNTTIKIESIQTSYNSEKINTQDKEINLQIEENNIKILEDDNINIDKKQDDSINTETEKNEINYGIYVLIFLITIMIVIFIIIIIKMKKRGEIDEK